MAVYVFNGERMVDRATGEPMVADLSGPLQAPRVMGDYEGYRSPIDGTWIEGRRARRYDLERSNSIDARDLPSKREVRFKNKRFMAKRGLAEQ